MSTQTPHAQQLARRLQARTRRKPFTADRYEGRGDFNTSLRRDKTSWAGIGVGEAFKGWLSYYVRLAGQRLFYGWAGQGQRAIAALVGDEETPFKARTKPQLSPYYTHYPAPLAGLAAVGLTCYLEYRARVQSRSLQAFMQGYLEKPAQADHVEVDAQSYAQVAQFVVGSVETRLLLENLARVRTIKWSVEMYRQFAASMLPVHFRSVRAIVQAVILYGDVLPAADRLRVHPTTRAIYEVVAEQSMPFFDRLASTKPEELIALGSGWVPAVCRALAPFFPPSQEPQPEPRPGRPHAAARLRFLQEAGFYHELEGRGLDELRARPSNGAESTDDEERIPPLDEPRPPVLNDKLDLVQFLFRLLRGRASMQEQLAAVLPDADPETMSSFFAFCKAVEEASGQHGQYQDIRADLLEHILWEAGFEEGPVQGNPTEGHEVTVRLQGDRRATGELFEQPVELSDDLAALTALAGRAKPISDALRRALYPNISPVPLVERFRTGGSLDPNRLPLGDISDAVYKRYRTEPRVDRRGNSVILIACDGSGSLDANQMSMLKTLTYAWVDSTISSDVQVLAGLYHSGWVRRGVTGPLVRWIYHPQKTPSINQRDALRTIPSLPASGTGAQSDVLSISHMLEEAKRLARHGQIYLILITDCAWNVSFPEINQRGKDEVAGFFEMVRQDYGEQLNTTMVALGVRDLQHTGVSGFEELIDKIIPVSDENLTNPDAVAQQVGLYVATTMQERRTLIARQ